MRGTNVAVYAMESRRTLPTGEQHLAGEHIVRDRTTVDIRRVLCPVDFSDFARRALDYAIAVARWYTCRLTVLYVHHVPVPSIAEFAGLATGPADGRVLSAADCEQLREQLKGLTPAEAVKNIPVEVSFAEGDVATEILAEADSIDMIVMGTHGRSGFDRLVLGSVTEKVIRRSPCSVMTIPYGTPGTTDAVPVLFHHILAAVDFSDASLRALTYAVSLAQEADAHLTVLHVTHIPGELAKWADEDPGGRAYVDTWKGYARRQLRPLVSDDARVYCHVDERVEVGRAHREILRVAAEQPSGLIVVGAHGAGVVERAFSGATTQHLVREATCPVLIVRAASDAHTSHDRTRS